MKRIFFALIALSLCTFAMAEFRTAEEAADIAAQALAPANGTMRITSSAPLRLSETITKINEATPAYYIFNRDEQSGFVVVSADTRALPVLCYSDEGELNMQTVNPSMKWWLERMQRQMSEIPADAELCEATEAYTAIAPLLGNTKWDQDTPYNNKCPMSYYYSNEHCLTGCVATATAQIMRYWQWPNKPTGQHDYEYYEYRNENDQRGHKMLASLDFSTITFDWKNMLDTYDYYDPSSYTTAQGNAVATLMFACGVACDMQYGSYDEGGSGAWTDDLGYGLKTYLGYQTPTFVTTATQAEYTESKGETAAIPCQWGLTHEEFAAAVYVELEAGRPILMGGEGEQGGHEFVCDGRDTRGYFHINWGWSGQSNCYTAVNVMTPQGESYSFGDMLDMLTGIIPDRADALEQTTTASPKAEKRLINGQIVIIKDGTTYSLMGEQL